MTTKQMIKSLVQIGSDPHVLKLVQSTVGFTDQEWDEAIQEQINLEMELEREERAWQASQLSQKEIECIFEANGISKEKMLQMKQNYILTRYEELVRIKERTPYQEKEKQDLKNEYRYRFEAKGVSPDDIRKAKEVSLEKIIKIERKFALCPFHNEKTPSMAIYKKDNSYYCFGCGESGDGIDLVKHLHHLNFKEAVKYLLGL